MTDGPIEELLGNVLSETAYEDQWRNSADPEDDERLANIQELLTVAREFDERHPGRGHLEAFLEETTLVNDTDDWDALPDRVTLMTLHASKGLEFPVVFIVAVEEGLLPHERSQPAPDQVEEERRLIFVGITRAQEELQISTAAERDFRGLRKLTVPSPFLMELPRAEMAVEVFSGGGSKLPAAMIEPADEIAYEEPVFRAEAGGGRPGHAGHGPEDGGGTGQRRPAHPHALARRLRARHARAAPGVRPGTDRGPQRQRERADGHGRFQFACRAKEARPPRQSPAAGEGVTWRGGVPPTSRSCTTCPPPG